jgi:hypothetical protein
MEQLDRIILKDSEMEDLPLFCRIIFHNTVSNISDEAKLFKYVNSYQSVSTVGYPAERIICKINILCNDDSAQPK